MAEADPDEVAVAVPLDAGAVELVGADVVEQELLIVAVAALLLLLPASEVSPERSCAAVSRWRMPDSPIALRSL